MRLLLMCTFLLATFFSHAQTGNVGIGTTQPQAQLQTTGSVRFDTLKGYGLRPVYVNDSGMLVSQGSVGRHLNSSGGLIPDNNCPGLSKPITVSGLAQSIASSSITVRINILHKYASELTIALIAPTGQILILSEKNGPNSQNYTNTVFSDAAAQSITSGTGPFTGTYKPQGNLSSLSGCNLIGTVTSFGQLGGGTINPNGVWTLRVFDIVKNDVGTLFDWSISFGTSADPNLLAAAYGVVYAAATNNIVGSSGNCTLAHTAGTGVYTISFTGANLSAAATGNLPIVISPYGTAPGFVSWTGGNGTITVYTFNAAGQPTDRGFSFAVYKP